MLYILAFLCPPLACLCSGKFLHACLNSFMFLTCVGYPMAVGHAWFVVKRVLDREGRRRQVAVIVNNRFRERLKSR